MACQGSRWRNYWRKTDPIGTALPELGARDSVDVTTGVKSDAHGRQLVPRGRGTQESPLAG